jgi:hypothetical protein
MNGVFRAVHVIILSVATFVGMYVYVRTLLRRYLAESMIAVALLAAYLHDFVTEGESLIYLRALVNLWSLHLGIIVPLLAYRTIEQVRRSLEP